MVGCLSYRQRTPVYTSWILFPRLPGCPALSDFFGLFLCLLWREWARDLVHISGSCQHLHPQLLSLALASPPDPSLPHCPPPSPATPAPPLASLLIHEVRPTVTAEPCGQTASICKFWSVLPLKPAESSQALFFSCLLYQASSRFSGFSSRHAPQPPTSLSPRGHQ